MLFSPSHNAALGGGLNGEISRVSWWEASAKGLSVRGHGCQSLQGPQGLFKGVSSLQVVMDGLRRGHNAPAAPCVCVCMHLHVRVEDVALLPSHLLSPPPPPVCALPCRQPYVRSPRCKCAAWLQNLPNLPCLQETKLAEEVPGKVIAGDE